MTETERIRFHSLRHSELVGEALTAENSRELLGYIAMLEEEESNALRTATADRESQIAVLDERVARMRSLVARREALAEYLRRIAQEVDAERVAIDAAFRQLIVANEPSATSLAGVSR